MNQRRTTRTRRHLLGGLALGTLAIAGCVGNGEDPADDTSDETDDDDSTVQTGNGRDDATQDDEPGADDTSDTPDETTDDDSADEIQDADDGDDPDADELPGASLDVPVLGDADAGVVLEVYEDLGCPACAGYAAVSFPTLESEYLDPERIRYEHRDLLATPVGGELANAAREVFERHGNEAFWAFKSAVFDRQENARNDPVETVSDIATDQELDTDEIVAAVEEERHAETITENVARGQAFGTPGTPSFVLDGELIETSAAGDFDELTAIISEAVGDVLETDDSDDAGTD